VDARRLDKGTYDKKKSYKSENRRNCKANTFAERAGG
jgi:hypothetical protein